jgi:hypothetical protein
MTLRNNVTSTIVELLRRYAYADIMPLQLTARNCRTTAALTRVAFN